MTLVHAFQCQHRPLLVVLSYTISVLGAYCALQWAAQIPRARGRALAGWLAGAALAMGGGAIWSMHFIAMLACELPVRVSYELGTTAASLLVAVVVTGAGLFVVSRGERSIRRLTLAGTFAGLGIAAMHYTGMAAMRMPARTRYEPSLLALSVLIAIVAATAALWIAFEVGRGWQRLASALVMGIAVCGMHYTAMAAASFVPDAASGQGAHATLARDELAFSVFGVTLVVLLLLSFGGQAIKRHRSAEDLRRSHAELERLVAQRTEAEEKLRKSEERFRLLARATSDVVWDWNIPEGTIWWNEGVQTVFGYDPEEASADSFWWSKHVEPADLSRVNQGMERAIAGPGSSWEDEYAFRRSDGSSARVLDRGFIIRDEGGRAVRMIGATVDISEHRLLEEQLRQSQKMEAVGQLAGGVAHDFNNLLTAVLGYAHLLEPRVAMDPTSLECVAEIRKAGERAAALTKQLLAFSRRQLLEPKVLDLNAVIRDIERMARRLISENIELATVLDPGIGKVLADAGQMQQVLLNLLVNSRDAMPRGGQLTVETSNTEIDASYAAQHSGVTPGHYVMLAVADTGVGMDAATRARIFEPFFTTKSPDQGTGLGLSTVYGIVKQSGGHLWAYSEPGKGTTMKVYLPRVEGPPAAEAASGRAPARRAAETILLVEDDPALRRLAKKIVADLGYTVLEADGGAQALEIAQAHPGRIDLTLTDVVMPGMGGSELTERLRALRPGMNVVFMSGYTDDAIIRHRVLEPGAAFLQKPFTPASLAEKLREALAAPAGRPEAGGQGVS